MLHRRGPVSMFVGLHLLKGRVMKSPEFPQYNFVTAKSFTKGRVAGQPRLIVIHTTESGEGKEKAENEASYATRRTDGTSAHFYVDSDSVIQGVRTSDEAHSARTMGNDIGIHIEICGNAGQSEKQWADPVSLATLQNVAQLCVALRKHYKDRFPLKRLSVVDVRSKTKTGFCGHVDVTKAFPQDHGDHTDPGGQFPWTFLFAQIVHLEKGVIVEPVQLEVVGTVPLLTFGYDDAEHEGYKYCMRVQYLLGIEPDGVYGPVMRQAVVARMRDWYSVAVDGNRITGQIWTQLYGLKVG